VAETCSSGAFDSSTIAQEVFDSVQEDDELKAVMQMLTQTCSKTTNGTL